jgi:sporadic carbohydrate cluster 2OG-Fe(II) oxygenase
MNIAENFTSEFDDELATEFLSKGYILHKTEELASLIAIRTHVVEIACDLLKLAQPEDHEAFLNNIQTLVSTEKLNDFRMTIYQRMNAFSWFRPTYFALGKTVLESIVGNELAMQNRINFSLQFPDDPSSLLSIHSDSFSGETPYQVVQWVPLVSAYDTKSMFILPPEHNRNYFPKFKEIMESGGSENLFETVREHLEWVDVPFGHVLIFSPNLFHGNVVNNSPETRWSMNVRFTGLFTPYASAEKNLGTFYLPITVKPVSRIGMNYRAPEGFDKTND